MGDDNHDWQTVRGRNRHGNNPFKPDIATSRYFKKENFNLFTTYFFSDIPDSFGAKALFNAFHYYGDIMEVVIPAKRDKGGRRFGFARFDRVNDPRQFEFELDNIIIGRNKISVNLSRFKRSEGNYNNDDRSKERKEARDIVNKDEGRTRDFLRNGRNLQFNTRSDNVDSYAQAARTGEAGRQREKQNTAAFSFEAEKDDMERLKKAFVGEVDQPGMSYNIQNAFHRQGYFGVKVTPLGANLALLEGQEDGEVEALMEDAKDWLKQWFRDIRPWSPTEVDPVRIVWLRVYGIPAHAWNDLFFTQVTKPWGSFINADDVTMKKLSMDVARLMIRSSCQKVVDEFLDVKINDDIFHLRVIEDSYGPMRIMTNQFQGKEGRDEEEEAEEEEEERLLVEEESERESTGEGENLLVINSHVNAQHSPINLVVTDEEIHEEREEVSRISNNITTTPILDSLNCLNFDVETTNLEGGAAKRVSANANVEFCMVQNLPSSGPTNSINSPPIVTGATNKRLSKSEDLGLSHKSNFLNSNVSGGIVGLKGGVYSDGPRSVYNKLNNGPQYHNNSKKSLSTHKHTGKAPLFLPSASLRKQQQLASSLKSRKQNSHISSSKARSDSSNTNTVSAEGASEVAGVRRVQPSMITSGTGSSGSLFPVDELLCCSSINSSDIRNCNRKFLKNYEHEVASKVWLGAL
ncbi:hypothetical protein L195_g027309, partial [Trifolium pratense]